MQNIERDLFGPTDTIREVRMPVFRTLLLSLITIQFSSGCGPARAFEPGTMAVGASETKSEEKASPSTSRDQVAVPDPADQASEPVSVAGAYLSCRYLENQVQNSPSYSIACAVEGNPTLAPGDAVASFSKLDSTGLAYPLTVVTSHTQTLSWTISETSATVYFPMVEAKISIRGAGIQRFTFEFKQAVPVKLDLSYWMVGEPSNGDTGVENCVEFYSQAERTKHASVYGASPAKARFNDRNCDNVESFICRNMGSVAGAKWLVSTFKGVFLDYPKACPSGYRFAVPMSDAEMVEVSAIIDASTNVAAYVPLTDVGHEGIFTFLFSP